MTSKPHPIPPGTRDILPEEMRELRRLQQAALGQGHPMVDEIPVPRSYQPDVG